MNDHIHPVMQQAIAGLIPHGFRAAPVMDAAEHLSAINQTLRAALDSFDAPPCPAGQFAYTFQHPELGPLDCHLEGERGDPECGQRDTATLYSAYLRGVDIADRLTRDEVGAIEIAAASKPIEQLEEL